MRDWLRERFEATRGGSAHHIRPMEGLRGFAVLLVFLVHYESLLAPWIANDLPLRAVAHTLLSIGDCGVVLFFLLSGYLIYGSLLGRAQSFQSFFARRLKRIYPAFTVVFMIYVALSLLVPSESKIPKDGAAGYLLANYLLLPGLFPIQPMITVAWSLSYEMFYYLTLPAMVVALKLRERTPGYRVWLFLLITAGMSAYTVMNGGPVRLIMFISGILLYETLHHSKVRVPAGWGAIALVAGLACSLWSLEEPRGETVKVLVWFVSFFAFGLACFRTPRGWLAAAFSWTPLRWLGNMSYSYYLLHGLVLKGAFLALAQVIAPTGEQSMLHWVLLAPMLALSLMSSAVLFFVIERPFSLSSPPQRSVDARACGS